MSSVFPLANYFTKSVSLTSTAKTTVYTCGDQGEISFDLTGLSAVASDGTADKVTFVRLQQSDSAEYVLVFNGPVETDYPLQLEGLPIHLVPGDIIKATSNGASGSHPTHIHISGLRRTRDPKGST
jgi:hypothetical protein